MKDQRFDDAGIQAMLNQMFLKEPQLLCPSSHRIMNLCINPNCKQSLACSEDDCKSCGVSVHPLCSLVPLRRVTHALNERVNQSKDLILKVLQIDNAFIAAVRESRQRLKKQCFLLSENKLQEMIDSIYKKKKNIQFVNGAIAKIFYGELQKKIDIREQIANKIEKYTKSMQKLRQDIFNLKTQLFQPVVSSFKFDSVILKSNDKTSQQQLIYLLKALKSPKQMQLLFRASEHSFKASAFHAQCDNIPNTLTLVKTEFGKTIAGFTKYPWTSEEKWVQQDNQNVFLLSLDLKQKMIPYHNCKLIYKSKQYGPIFGLANDSSSNDLTMKNDCHLNKIEHNIFPSTFNYEGEPKYTQSQQTSKLFSGATNGHGYKVIEYEVFKVIY